VGFLPFPAPLNDGILTLITAAADLLWAAAVGMDAINFSLCEGDLLPAVGDRGPVICWTALWAVAVLVLGHLDFWRALGYFCGDYYRNEWILVQEVA